MKKQSGFRASTGIALTCTALLWGWRALFGKVSALLFLSVLHRGFTTPFQMSEHGICLPCTQPSMAANGWCNRFRKTRYVIARR